MTAAPVAAFEIFGMKFFEDESDADAVIADPQPYTVVITVNATGGVESAVRNASALVADQNEPASGAAGLLAKARGDYRRIVAALYNEGHYGGTVSIRVGGAEAANLAPDVNLPDPVDVAIVVDPGPLFRFSSVNLVNQAAPTNDPFDYVEPPLSVGFGTGEIAKSSVILRAEQLALEAWRQQGHAKAVIVSRDVVADHATQLVDVTITVNPGAKAAFGAVTVSGTERMDPEFVRRQTGLTVGEEYDPDELALAQRRLDRLEVFRAARLEAAEAIGADGLLPYNLIVQELPGRRFGVGATYSTIDGLGLEAFHLWRNLFGQAERLRLDARVASIAWPIDTAQFDYFFGGTFTKPGMFTPDTDLIAAVSAERTIYPTYSETSAGGRVGLTHMLSDQITLEGGTQFEINRFDDVFGTRDFKTVGLYGGAVLDFRDDSVDATSGWYGAVNVEPFYELNYGNAAARLTVEGRTYFGFGEDDPFVLAGRLKAGALVGPSLAEIPPDKLFFAGGGGSVRGYGFKSIGVDNGAGVITGGRYLLEASIEARAKVTEDIGVVGFVDGGYVAADVFPALTDLRIGAGVGVRYYTGLGPLRLDVAVPLNKRAGDPDYALYVGIGQAF
ncbi:MAG: autotransporter assembly complex protein TamA [Alphaproteobacteria bacterium]|nr:autotransporter assembly complex protein TamA [Alphaproteobacteria bacterium]MBU1560659.1 autotransporter assembly complex protein TamA [Alphaproteobacteria bacterium]MBU2301957.1 autotransporter assembly complex protein TamA [Alphaproteobacteria bacterium]MBU2368029.1 autotransporter assembly complex protein TamA [Alphaproteobacteria bacterium]